MRWPRGLAQDGLGGVRVVPTGEDGVDLDLVGGEVDGEGAGQAQDGRFWR